MGLAVGRRTVFRPEDAECFGRVADRVAAGNMSLLGRPLTAAERDEQARLRNAIATGALITSGRHLQHGDADQASRNMEVFTNCATAIASFAKFYLLLNGSGVGRAYDDELVVVDWAAGAGHAALSVAGASGLSAQRRRAAPFRRRAVAAARPRRSPATPRRRAPGSPASWWPTSAQVPAGAIVHQIADSREGWAKAMELLESMAFAGARGRDAGVRPLRHPPRAARRSAACRGGRPRARSPCCARC